MMAAEKPLKGSHHRPLHSNHHYRPRHRRNQIPSEITYCDEPIKDCAFLLKSTNLTEQAVAKLHTLYLCPVKSWRTIRPRSMSKDLFLGVLVQALSRRREMCDFEHQVIASQLAGTLIEDKVFSKADGFPIYGSYDLLAAALISMNPQPYVLAKNTVYDVTGGYWLELG
ncbi:hypothetical protein EON64_17630, partial [archaeon]